MKKGSCTEKEHPLPLWLKDIIHDLDGVGLNIYGIASGAPYTSLLPNCASVIVFASGGSSLWEHFIADIQQNPHHLQHHQHPLDDFVYRCITRADAQPPLSRRWIRCAAVPEEFLDFRPLAKEAGLGWPSLQGMLLHPKYGLWMGLRAALLTTEVLAVSGPLGGDGPCKGCSKPCIAACPGDAVGKEGWNVQTCAAFHQRSTLCHGKCHSRLACPEGELFRHGELQHHYHNARGSGRELLAKKLGIKDIQSGIDPPWEEWEV